MWIKTTNNNTFTLNTISIRFLCTKLLIQHKQKWFFGIKQSVIPVLNSVRVEAIGFVSFVSDIRWAVWIWKFSFASVYIYIGKIGSILTPSPPHITTTKAHKYANDSHDIKPIEIENKNKNKNKRKKSNKSNKITPPNTVQQLKNSMYFSIIYHVINRMKIFQANGSKQKSWK